MMLRTPQGLYSSLMRHALSAAVGLAVAGSLAACAPRGARPAARPTPPAPDAEFLISAGDSTFWVRSGASGIRVRGAPLLLAHYGQRFYELYVADDDRSYYDAVFTGQRVFRRDIETGDSLAVFEDTTVPHAARAYAASHPSDVPLGPDDDASDDPSTSVTGDVDILDVHGPYVSLEFHASREGRATTGARQITSRQVVGRAVVDLRRGHVVSLRAIFGHRGGDSVGQRGRRAYREALDSVLARQATADGRARAAARSLSAFPFDSASFTLSDIAGQPAVAFFVPGRGDQGGHALGLPAVRAPVPPWWDEERRVRPIPDSDSTSDAWQRAAVTVTARYDTTGEAHLTLADSAHREWSLARVPAPVRRLYWLDRPPVDAATRRALVRAFDESALYADDARAARMASRRARRPLMRLTGLPNRRYRR